uniref:Uncharacterized protein n=1 Tax=viral metagenome TaxID=1070528 RepID=A0A6M3J2H1_9ZZZZ
MDEETAQIYEIAMCEMVDACGEMVKKFEALAETFREFRETISGDD